MNITDIVVEINDFLVVPDTVAGMLYLSQNGGVNLMLKSAVKEERYLLNMFFQSIQDVPSVTETEHDYYFYDIKIPPIVMDHLLDADTDENILRKVENYLKKKGSWMSKNGLIAIARMTFHHHLCSKYRMYDTENMELLNKLSKKYTIHLLGNCSRESLNTMVETDKSVLDCVEGNILTSSDLNDVKCSSSDKWSIYDKFFEKCNIKPENTLFIETHPGHIGAINKYAETIGKNITTILYENDKLEFMTKLSQIVSI